MRISERLLTMLACCLLAAAIPAHAGGKGERELQQAQDLVDAKKYAEAIPLLEQVRNDFPALEAKVDKMIAPVMLKRSQELFDQKQYSQALKLLADLMTRYPDLREEADDLVARIMKVREQFNEKYRQLLAVGDDVERGLAIIKELEQLDPNPDPAVKRSIAVAYRYLQRKGEFNKFGDVMKAAAAQLAEGKHAEAIGTYLAGFSISRADFDAAAYPALQRDSALAAVESLEDAAHSAAASQDRLAALPTALEALLGKPVTESVRQGFFATFQPLVQAREREESIRASAVRVREANVAIDAANGDDEPNDLWLYFVELYALGRADAAPEGIAVAVRRPWVGTARTLSDTAFAAAEAAYAAMDGAFTTAKITPLAEFRTLAGEARNRGLLAITVLEAEQPAWKAAEGLRLSGDDEARAAELASRLGLAQKHVADADAREAFAVAEAGAGDTLADLERRLASVPSPSVTDATALRRGRTDLDAIRGAAASNAAAWAERAASEASGSVVNARAAAVNGKFARLESRALAADAALAARTAGLEAAGFASRLTDAATRQERGRALKTGTTTGQAPAGKRPDLAKEEYMRALTDIGVLLKDIDAWRERWMSEPAHVSASAPIVQLTADQDGVRARVVVLQAAIAADDTAADTAISLATQYRGQGDTAFAAAQTHEKEKRYTAAQGEYDTAFTSYGASLEQMENATVRARYDDLPRLIAAIKQLVVRQAVVDVERQVNEGITQYKNTDFATAVATLEKAKAQWDAVYPDPKNANDTLEYYLGLSRSAQKLSGRREITRTDPIYQDVRGFMTQAELSYNEATRLKKANSTSEEYRKNIDAAKSSVEAITTAVPEFREARLMELKIERLNQGEARFAQLLHLRVADALTKARDPRATDVTMRDTRLSLMDYQGIEGVEKILSAAERRQIEAAIFDLEVRLRLRAPAPDPALIKLSQTKYAQARTLYDRSPDNRNVWEQALLLLKESLAANIDNLSARALQSEINRKRGGSTEDLLSADEYRRYLEANTLIAQNDLPRAEAIIDDLIVRKPRNQLLLNAKAEIKVRRGQ